VAGASTLDGVGMTLNNMRVLVGTGESLRLVGSIENNSTIELADLQSTGLNSSVLTYDGSSPTGTGEVVFKTANQNLVTSVGQTTLTSGQTIRTDGAIAGTRGQIQADMVNEGLIHADNGEIDLSSTDKANRATMRASNGGTLRLSSIDVDNLGGQIAVDNSSTLEMSGAGITGGSVTGTGSIEVISTASWDSVDVGMLTTRVGTGESLRLQGSIGHTGTILLADLQTTGLNSSVVSVDASGATLSGAGEIQFTTANQNQIGGTGTLELRNGHEIHALAGSSGQIRTQVVNRGIIRANGTISLLDPALLDNTADGVITGDGTLDLNGTLNNNGTITAGNSPGSLFIDGSVDNSSSSTLLIEIDGSGGIGNRGSTYDFIDVSGSFDLAGTLAVDLLNFVPNFADEYFILNAGSILGGVDDFLNVVGGIATLGFGTADVRIDNGTDLVLFNLQLNQTNPVPAPGSFGLLLAGLIIASARRRRASDN
ncbi:MAG: PEP-CTERM sorting domain-containing protein, partial [Pseudomonadota bacterium]